MKTIITNLSTILQKPTVFICGDNEKLNVDALNYVLFHHEKIEHYYFYKPVDELEAYLKSVSDNSLFSIINNYDDIKIDDLSKYDLLICGIKPLDKKMSDKIVNFKNKITIYFPNIGLFSQMWQKNKNIEIIEQSFQSYTESDLANFGNGQIVSEPEIISGADYFVNRGAEFDIHTRTPHKRGYKIIGMVGVGKRAFVNELKKNYGLNTNCFEFFFKDKTDNLSDILITLFSKMGIRINEQEIKKITLKKEKGLHPKIQNFFDIFDNISNAKIIFYNIDEIYDLAGKKFYKHKIEEFFSIFLNRATYSGNKVYFVSKADFYIGEIDDRIIQNITLLPLSAFHIKLILAQGFSEQNKGDWANTIRNTSDEKIEQLVDGHPYIAQLFVRVSLEVGLEKLLNDIEFQRYFEREHKIKYLMDKMPLTDRDKKILSYLSLFKDNVEVSFIERISTNVPEDIASLKRKFLLEIIELKNGGAKYYVPTLIQNYVISQFDSALIKKNHSDIGDFFWTKAEKFDAGKKEVVESYRYAFYHYTKSENEDKKQQLLWRFKEKFLEQGREYYFNRYFPLAWMYYNELYLNNELTNANGDLSNYLESEIYANTKDKQITQDKFDKALKEYGAEANLLTVYAKFLFFSKKYNESLEICHNLLGNKFPSKNFKINNLFPKVLYKLGYREEAERNILLWIQQLEQIGQSSLSIVIQIINNYSYYVTMKNNQISIKSLVRDVLNMLKDNNLSWELYLPMIEDSTEYTPLIISEYEKLVKGKNKKGLYNDYSLYLKSKKISIEKDLGSENIENVDYKTEKIDLEEVLQFAENEADILVEELADSRLVSTIKNEIAIGTYFLHNNNFSTEQILINLQKHLEETKSTFLYIEKSLKYDTFFDVSKLRLQYITRLKFYEYLINLNNIITAAQKNTKSPKVVFVEGATDKRLIEKAVELFGGGGFLTEIIDCKSSNGLFNEVMSWVYKTDPLKGKAFAILDNDTSGLNTYQKLQKEENFIYALQKNLIKIQTINPEHFVQFYKIGLLIKRQPDGDSKKDFPFEVEHLFPIEIWEYASEVGWLEKRDEEECRKIATLFRIGIDDSLENFIRKKLEDSNISYKMSIFLTHKFKDDCKMKICSHIISMEENNAKSCLINFFPLIKNIQSFFSATQ